MYEFDALERFHKDLKRGFHPATTEKINRSEMDLLVTLKKFPGQPFRFYGRHIHLEKSSFSYVVDLLVLKELVVKQDDQEDRRKKTLVLTEKGETTVEELKSQYKAYIDKKMSIFTAEEQKDIRQALEVIKEHGAKLHELTRKEHDMKKKEMMHHHMDPHHMRDHKMHD